MKFYYLLTALIILSFTNCVKKNKDTQKQDITGDLPVTPTETEALPSPVPDNTEISNTAASLGFPNDYTLGLQNFCTSNMEEELTACIHCKPRNIDIDRCFNVDLGFDVTKSCAYKNLLIKCKGVGETFVSFDLENTIEEKMINTIPTIMATIKNLSAKYKGKDDKGLQSQALINAVADYFDAHAEDLVLSKDPEKSSSEISGMVKEEYNKIYDPDLNQNDEDKIKNSTKLALDYLKTIRLKGNINFADGLILLGKITAIFPDMDIQKFIASLNITNLL